MRLLRYLILFGRHRTPGDEDPPDPKDEKREPGAEAKEAQSGDVPEPEKLR